jgi:TolA-binding protein
MTEPREELSNAAKKLLDSERLRPGPSAADAQAVLDRLMGAGAFAAGAAATPASGAVVAKVLLGALVGGAVGAGAVSWRASTQLDQAREELATVRQALAARELAPPTVVREPPSQAVAAEAPSAPSPAGDPAPSPTARRRTMTEPAASPPPVEPAPPARESLDREAALIERARTALLKRDFESAAAALLEHQEKLPGGRMVEERELMLVQLSLARGRYAEARTAARRFRQAYPASLFTSTLNALFQGADGIDESKQIGDP